MKKKKKTKRQEKDKRQTWRLGQDKKGSTCTVVFSFCRKGEEMEKRRKRRLLIRSKRICLFLKLKLNESFLSFYLELRIIQEMIKRERVMCVYRWSNEIDYRFLNLMIITILYLHKYINITGDVCVYSTWIAHVVDTLHNVAFLICK